MNYECGKHPRPQLPNVYLDVSVENTYLGRIEIKLYKDCPKTVENFRCLISGEKGKNADGVKLHYKGNIFHRIIPHFMIQGGDITHRNGTGGHSIYGRYFKDESFKHKHDGPFKVAMANCGEKNTNGSQFYISLMKCPWLDNNHVVFGEVVKGKYVVKKLEEYGSPEG